ncbi:protein alan shepard-like [Rhagoletis pomonella]|uniref:protein alan shepard-like n=1 Tax=Rhagoletis pomonella TaxID=28610 RepID=UPI00177BB057|nr:protein alan shepard-like [Rhagoletis pomonella]
MQHHAHVARTAPPHMRGHHMAVPPPHSQTQSHMPPLNMTHVPPPPTGQQQQQQPLQSSQQQNQPQHLTNGPAPSSGGGSAAVITGSKIGAPSHIRDHHTRFSINIPLPVLSNIPRAAPRYRNYVNVSVCKRKASNRAHCRFM